MIGNGLARALLHATNRLVERRTKQAPAYSDACAQVTPGFAHPHGKHAGDIRLWTLSQEWLAVHHVIDGLRDVGGMIAHALDIFLCKIADEFPRSQVHHIHELSEQGRRISTESDRRAVWSLSSGSAVQNPGGSENARSSASLREIASVAGATKLRERRAL
jgi:hypothetical protein